MAVFILGVGTNGREKVSGTQYVFLQMRRKKRQTEKLTNSMEPRPSSEVASRSATPGFYNVLWNPKV